METPPTPPANHLATICVVDIVCIFYGSRDIVNLVNAKSVVVVVVMVVDLFTFVYIVGIPLFSDSSHL